MSWLINQKNSFDLQISQLIKQTTIYDKMIISNKPIILAATLLFSISLVSMTIALTLYSHTILQKSSCVEASGPWAAMYWRLEK